MERPRQTPTLTGPRVTFSLPFLLFRHCHDGGREEKGCLTAYENIGCPPLGLRCRRNDTVILGLPPARNGYTTRLLENIFLARASRVPVLKRA